MMMNNDLGRKGSATEKGNTGKQTFTILLTSIFYNKIKRNVKIKDLKQA